MLTFEWWLAIIFPAENSFRLVFVIYSFHSFLRSFDVFFVSCSFVCYFYFYYFLGPIFDCWWRCEETTSLDACKLFLFFIFILRKHLWSRYVSRALRMIFFSFFNIFFIFSFLFEKKNIFKTMQTMILFALDFSGFVFLSLSHASSSSSSIAVYWRRHASHIIHARRVRTAYRE